MAFKTDYDSDAGNVSKFNEAYFKMMRLHEMQKLINECSTNLLAINGDYGVYNYELVFKTLNQLLLEAWGKINEDQRKQGTNMRETIKMFLLKNPIVINKKDLITNQNINKINNVNLIILEDWLFKYHSLIKELLEKVGYGSPNFDDFEDEL